MARHLSLSSKNIFYIFGSLLSVISLLAGGYFFFLYFRPIPSTLEPTPSISPQPLNSSIPAIFDFKHDSDYFSYGNHYFTDTVFVISKQAPYEALVATVSRGQRSQDVRADSRVSYYNGTKWNRFQTSHSQKNSQSEPDDITKQWNILTDNSRVLREQSDGEFALGNDRVLFNTTALLNEIGMRSEPGYTKFMSEGSGTLEINGTTHSAYVLYSRIYSMNGDSIQFYDHSLGVITDWVAFWDTNGNFYHLDKTDVAKPSEIYASHAIGVMKKSDGGVYKTFAIDASRDSLNDPKKFSYIFNDPVNATLSIDRTTQHIKEPFSGYTWFMGHVTGSATHDGISSSGVGIVEYIHD